VVTWQWQLQQKLGIQAVIFYFRTRFFLISACQRRLAPTAEGAGGADGEPSKNQEFRESRGLGSDGIFLYANLLKTKSGRSYGCKSSEIP